MKLLLALILASNALFAVNAVKISEGEPAPFTGVILTSEKVIELDKAQRENEILNELKLTQENIIKYHKEDAKMQRKKLAEAKFESFAYNVGYFFLGVILSSYAYKLSQEIQQWHYFLWELS